MTLTDFLLARIAEDEDAAREMAHAVMRGETPSRMGFPTHLQGYLTTQSPARVFDECDSKQRLVDWHQADEQGRCVDDHHYPHPCPTLRFLALPYASHEDYREEWAL